MLKAAKPPPVVNEEYKDYLGNLCVNGKFNPPMDKKAMERKAEEQAKAEAEKKKEAEKPEAEKSDVQKGIEKMEQEAKCGKHFIMDQKSG